jgi:hypothetical protein
MGASLRLEFADLKHSSARAEQRRTKVRLLSAVLGFSALIVGASADDEIPSGFYAATQKSCFEATGQVFHCRDGRCLFQEYQGTMATGEPVDTEVVATIHPRTDRNGFEVALGDAILKYKQFGGDFIRVVRPEGRTITTTNLARTDRYGKVTFAFLENGTSKDPSIKPQVLSRCEAYSVSELEQILADGLPKYLPRIETDVPPGLPLEFEYADADNPADQGVVTKIPILATAPREDAYIVEAVPVTGRNPDYPDIMVLWTVSPGTPTPIQFLGYDPAVRAYVDKTTSLLAPGSNPLVDNPHGVRMGLLIEGRPSVFLANGGIDAKPWLGSLDTLLVLNADGKWEDQSSKLPRREGWSEGAALGQLNAGGDLAVYVTKINSTPGAGSQILKFGSDGVQEVSESAAPSGLAYTKVYSAAGFADVNGDEADDLVLGSDKGLKLFLNSGNGSFAQSPARQLPPSPLPSVFSPVTGSKNPPSFVSIEAIVRQEGEPVDLLTVSSPFYKGYAIQYLQNDGSGNFTDQTARFLHGGRTNYVSETEENFVWVRRAFAFERDGVQDIITRSAGTEEVSSQVYLNTDGEFRLALTVNGWTIENAMHVNGQPVLLTSNTQNLALMAYPH